MDRKDEKTEYGITYALRKFKIDVEKISRGENYTVENIIRSCFEREKVDEIRSECWRVMSRTACYLNEKFVGYNSPLYKAIRGEIASEHAVADLERNRYCCAPTDLDRKAMVALSRVSGKEYDTLRFSLIVALKCTRNEFLRKSGPSTLLLEHLFSLLRSLGVRMPHRACSLFVPGRELPLQRAWKIHHDWIEKRAADLFGSARNMYRIFRSGKSKFNGFTEFCKAWRLRAAGASELWCYLDDVAKFRWCDNAVLRKSANDQELSEAKQKLRDYHGCGPCGSRLKNSLIDFEQLKRDVWHEDGVVRNMWKKQSISDAMQDANRASNKFNPPTESVQYYSSISLAGDCCSTCRSETNYAKSRLQVMRYILTEQFKLRNGKQVGLFLEL